MASVLSAIHSQRRRHVDVDALCQVRQPIKRQTPNTISKRYSRSMVALILYEITTTETTTQTKTRQRRGSTLHFTPSILSKKMLDRWSRAKDPAIHQMATSLFVFAHRRRKILIWIFLFGFCIIRGCCNCIPLLLFVFRRTLLKFLL